MMNKSRLLTKVIGWLGVLIIACTMAPLSAIAAERTSPPEEPYEKVLYTNGSWGTELMRYDNQTKLIVTYQGSWESQTGQNPVPASSDKALISFKLKSKSLLRGVYLPFTYPTVNPKLKIVSFFLRDSKGNIYGPYETIPVKTNINLQDAAAAEGILISVDEKGSKDNAPDKIFIDNVFVAATEIILPAGNYSLYTNDDGRMVRNNQTNGQGAVLIKGIDYSAWQRYKEKLLQWESAGRDKGVVQEDENIAISVSGSTVLSEVKVKPENYQAAPPKTPAQRLPASLTLKESSLVDEIVFNTYNGGKGAAPGFITVTDQKGQVQGKFQANGGLLGKAANGIWAVNPGIVLPAGVYTLSCSDPAVVTYNEDGTPDFYAAVAPVPPKRYDFTGRYYIDLAVSKASTLMGPVKDGQNALDLKSFELSVIDKGEVIELIGKYEGMPFSQECKVTKREENNLTAAFNFAADLRNLPYKAKIGAAGTVNLQKPPGLQAKVTIAGQGTYERPASKTKGADYNTYKIAGQGSMASPDLPGYVAAALGAKIASAGNIPGPDSPAQAAAGALFPPLVGLIVHVLQTMLKPKPEAEHKSKLSVGEQAMADANQSLGKGLYTEEEAKAWATLADALGNSDEPDDDPFSVGDNEKPGGSDYVAPESGSGYGDGSEGADEGSEGGYEESDNGESSPNEDTAGEEGQDSAMPVSPEPEKVFGTEREQLEAEREEWLKNLAISQESADPQDPRSQELHTQYKDYIGYLESKINDLKQAEKYAKMPKMTVQVDHTGRTAEIGYDEETGKWQNLESGNEFDMNRYEKDVAPGFAKTKEFVDTQRHKLEKGDTDFDRAMKALVEDNKQRANLLGQLQKIRNQSYGIVPPAPGVGDVQGNIDKLINDLSDRSIGTQELRDKAVRIAKVVTDRNTGATMSEEAAKKLIDREMSYTHAAAQTVSEGFKDVITGRTKAGIAGRAGLAILTGGVSEYVMSPAEAMIDIKESMDSGESGTRATLKAMGKYVLGELGGEYMGEAWKRSGYSINPDAIKKAADLGNTPVSKILGLGGAAGSKEAVGGLASSAQKGVLGSADSNLGHGASDLAEYAKYKADVKNQASIIENKIRTAAGNKPITPEDVSKALSGDDIRKVLRDPSVTRELKNTHPGVQKAYQDVLDSKLYKPANANTAKQLESDLLADVQKQYGSGAKIKVEVESIRTPGTKGSPLNADNDLTGKITITDANGKTIVKEIPADQVAPIYNKNFAEAAGMIKDGKFDVAKAKLEMPEGIKITDAKGHTKTIGWEEATPEQQLEAFAKKHNQEVTDVHSAEAATDFNAAKNADGISNVGKLKAGDPAAALADPGGLAKMEQYKINNYFNKGGVANQTEAYEQLAKMGKLTNDLTNAYQKLGYNAKDLTGNMQTALDVAANRNLSPGARTLELQKLGFKGPGDLANKLSGRIEGLQKLGAPQTGKGDGEMVKKLSSIIIGSYLNEQGK